MSARWSAACWPSLTALPLVLLLAVWGEVPQLSGVGASEIADDSEPPFEIVEELGGQVTALAARGDHIYLGIGAHLVVLDADTPTGVPEARATSERLHATIDDAAVLASGLVAVLAGDVVYFVDADAVVVASFTAHKSLRAVEAWGETCLLLGDRSILLADASDPAAAHELAAITLPSPTKRNTQMLASDGLLFVGGGLGSVLVYDIAHPASPRLLGGIESELVAGKMAVSGRRLYVIHDADVFDEGGARLLGVLVYSLEVRDDGKIDRHGFVELVRPTPVPGEFMAVDMAADGARLYVSGAEVGPNGFPELRQIRCWDLEDAARPVEVSRTSIKGIGSTVRMVISDGRLYLAANEVTYTPGGYQSPAIGSADISETGGTSWLGHWQLDALGGVEIVAAAPSAVAIKEHLGRIHMFEGQYRSGHRQAGYVAPADIPYVREMELDGERLYTLGGGQLSVFDLSNGWRPALRAQAEVITYLPALAVSAPYVIATEGSSFAQPGEEAGYWLVVLEVIDGAGVSVRRLGTVPAASETIRDIAISGHYVFAVARDSADRPERLALFDIRDPSAPRFMEDVALPDGVLPKGIAVEGEYAYVAVRQRAPRGVPAPSGLFVLDVSDPVHSRVVGSVWTDAVERASRLGEEYNNIEVIDEYALIACEETSVHVVKVSDPEQPSIVDRVSTQDIVTDIEAASRHVYVVTRDGGMITLRATYAEPEPAPGKAAFLPLAVTD